jgi:hypothetical protein
VAFMPPLPSVAAVTRSPRCCAPAAPDKVTAAGSQHRDEHNGALLVARRARATASCATLRWRSARRLLTPEGRGCSAWRVRLRGARELTRRAAVVPPAAPVLPATAAAAVRPPAAPVRRRCARCMRHTAACLPNPHTPHNRRRVATLEAYFDVARAARARGGCYVIVASVCRHARGMAPGVARAISIALRAQVYD